jgi:hypothetical protein
MKLEDWFLDNCRLTAKKQFVCVHGNEVEVISPISEEDAKKDATDENIRDFLEENKTYREVKYRGKDV